MTPNSGTEDAPSGDGGMMLMALDGAYVMWKRFAYSKK